MFGFCNPFSNQDLAEEIGCYYPTGNKSSFCVLANNSSPCWGPLFWSAPLSWSSHTHRTQKWKPLASFCRFDFADNGKIRTNNLKMDQFLFWINWQWKDKDEPYGFEIQLFQMILRGVLLEVEVQKAMTGIFVWTWVQPLVYSDCWGLIPTYWC